VKSRRGFTLIELLIVVVIVGLLASIAIPKFGNTKGKAYLAAMKSDLRNLATAEEAFVFDSATYSNDLTKLRIFPSSGVTLVVNEATGGGWSATATHLMAAGRHCYLFYGNAAPIGIATVEGRIVCD
jgi:prepilin-type N-terminal cleavage/methylation domain-containing protein